MKGRENKEINDLCFKETEIFSSFEEERVYTNGIQTTLRLISLVCFAFCRYLQADADR